MKNFKEIQKFVDSRVEKIQALEYKKYELSQQIKAIAEEMSIDKTLHYKKFERQDKRPFYMFIFYSIKDGVMVQGGDAIIAKQLGMSLKKYRAAIQDKFEGANHKEDWDLRFYSETNVEDAINWIIGQLVMNQLK